MRRSRMLVLIALTAILGAAKCNPLPPTGVFTIHGATGLGADTDAIHIQPPFVSTDSSGCSPVEASFERVLVDGATVYPTAWRVIARWDRCKTVRSEVLLKAVLDQNGAGLQGTLEIGKIVQPFTASTTFGDSLRFATQNTQMLPSFFAAGTLETNARHMAERILASGYDFIALNEVFDADIQEIFVQELRGTFPYWVQYIDAADLEDSGLQFFSRFPFEPLPVDLFKVPALDCVASDHGVAQSIFNDGKADCERVAFIEFDDCEGDDCFASKGAAYVRLRNPANNEVYNVVFTHMQANYVPADFPNEKEDFVDAVDERDVRIKQLANIEQLLFVTTGNINVIQDETFVLGDLNIDGHLDAPDQGFIGPNVVNIHEWNSHFGTGGGFFKNQLGDSWAVENSPKDPSGNYDRGVTNASHWGAGGPGARLDYILRSQKSRMCSQHMTLTRNLRWSPPGDPLIETGLGPFGVGQGGTRDLSDHYGVNMDLNARTPNCRPVDAKLVMPPGGGNIQFLSGTTTHPGQIVWYRFDEKGTYSFQMVSNDGFTFRVYESNDLTTPAPVYKNETTSFVSARGIPFEGKEFRVSEAPFYVRVYHQNRKTVGSYQLRVVKHDCGSQALACALAAGERVERQLSPIPPLNGEDEAWFELFTEATPGNLVQSLEFMVRDLGITALQYFQLELREDDGTTVVATDITTAADTGSTLKLQIDHQETLKTKYYLVVKRLPATAPPYPAVANSYTMFWTTDLTIFFGANRGGQSIRLWCLEENDGLDLDGDDEMYLQNAKIGSDTVVGGPQFIGDFDAGTQHSMEGMLGQPIYFTGGSKLKIHVYEDDDFAAGANDEFTINVGALPRSKQGPIEADKVFAPGGSGKYRFFYNVTHGFDD